MLPWANTSRLRWPTAPVLAQDPMHGYMAGARVVLGLGKLGSATCLCNSRLLFKATGHKSASPQLLQPLLESGNHSDRRFVQQILKRQHASGSVAPSGYLCIFKTMEVRSWL